MILFFYLISDRDRHSSISCSVSNQLCTFDTTRLRGSILVNNVDAIQTKFPSNYGDSFVH